MNWTLILTLYICLTNNLSISAQNPFDLRALAALRNIPLGTAALVDNLRNNVDGGKHNANIKKNYLLIVPEYEMKPQHIWLGDNIYKWTNTDWLLGSTPNSTGWIQQNGMQLRGHNLVWPGDSHMPSWLLKQESSITSEKAKSLMSDYIHTVVGRYRGKIAWWDVVNEAVDDLNNSRPFNLRDCFWFRKLGPDFMKYAFIFAHEADPNVQLYYNDYNIERLSTKANKTRELISWLKSQGATVHGIGLQWHIDITKTVTPGDDYYRNAQLFIDQGLDLMITELDVAIPIKDGKPINPIDLEKQGLLYRSLLRYALYFLPRCQAMLTWGFTDRYSWIPSFTNNTKGDALPLDRSYQPKPAYWQMQEELARVLTDGVYYLSPQSQPTKCLGASDIGTSNNVQLYGGICNSANQKWSITWLGDGTYRLSPTSASNRALNAYNATSVLGGVQTYNWSGDTNQEWVIVPQGNNIFRVSPRTAWWRVMSVYGTANIGILNYTSDSGQNWILTRV
jgi:endo-1,4-beta-xylanase